MLIIAMLQILKAKSTKAVMQRLLKLTFSPLRASISLLKQFVPHGNSFLHRPQLTINIKYCGHFANSEAWIAIKSQLADTKQTFLRESEPM